MRKFWLGIAILVLLLLFSLLSGMATYRLHNSLSEDFSQAARLASTDWAQAQALTASARSKWLRWRHGLSALADHGPLEQMESLFRVLAVYASPSQWEPYAATCSQLSALAEKMGEEQLPLWWNLL